MNEENNKTVITDTKHPNYYDEDNLEQLWYQSYRNHGGVKLFDEWKSYLEWFLDHISPGMVQHTLTKRTWNKWVKMIGSPEEAESYVDGVDEVTPLT